MVTAWQALSAMLPSTRGMHLIRAINRHAKTPVNRFKVERKLFLLRILSSTQGLQWWATSVSELSELTGEKNWCKLFKVDREVLLARLIEVSLVSGSGSGLVISWEQETGNLLASGDVRFIRVWDTQREMRMQVRKIKKKRCCFVVHCSCLKLNKTSWWQMKVLEFWLNTLFKPDWFRLKFSGGGFTQRSLKSSQKPR